MKTVKVLICNCLVAVNPIWGVLTYMALVFEGCEWIQRVYQRLLYQKSIRSGAIVREVIARNFTNLAVAAGPFAGLVYPRIESAGSMVAPKLLGTYESEISTILDDGFFEKYKVCLDVGCAEGYYAVGVALRNPSVKVFAYDISSKAREMCREMARINGVEGRVTVCGEFKPNDLRSFFNKRTILISDCEGFEREIFTHPILDGAVGIDFLIEVHEHMGAKLANILAELKSTHSCRVYGSLWDVSKGNLYRTNVTDSMPISERVLIFAECRSVKMHWVYAQCHSGF